MVKSNSYDENIHIRVNRHQMVILKKLSEHYQTSLSNLVRYFIHHGLLNEKSISYNQTMNQTQRGF